eukprot:CAMPEP_0113306690 /NCGR_PEP_ID=MMETSP0010_2-20120614/5843_1 /TAXON_ID=216773 ORGANISM="Corethron hystrix, Strain 308" /NCGR_SAMPLE_ID=MMETSP0010_2 /ASSEMBLY_ACC=CAM_ASM_000155 /LENGTH=226 /DNA_ID=CAMNT_0000161413 /DNA_START=215 /DNA_END=895 /DNA_ORIENTATION=+ /assembly_acc=CAM_ASM_000155
MSVTSIHPALTSHAHQKRGRSYFDELNESDISSPFGGYASSSKRRRHDRMEEDSDGAVAMHSPEHTTSSSAVCLTHHSVGNLRTPLVGKRQRKESLHSPWGNASQQPQTHYEIIKLQGIISQQNSEIDRNKTEKEKIRREAQKLSDTFEKVSNENRILKRAVAIQQERNTQAVVESEGLKKLNSQAAEHIQRCEREILMLRAHVGVQGGGGSAGFLGFEPRPPDVF